MTKPIITDFGQISPLLIQQYQHYLPTAFSDELSLLQKTNKIIQKLGEIGTITNDIITQWNTVFAWVTGEGLSDSAQQVVNDLIADGTIGNLINNGLLSNVITQLGSKANQTDVTALQNQLSALVVNGTPTDGNAELIDSRVTSFNKTYDTVGNRLRNNDDFASYTRSMTTDYSAYVPSLSSYSYVDKNTKVLTAHSGYALTLPVECQYNDEFLVTTYLSGPLVGTAVQYDQDMNVLSVMPPYGNNTTDPQTSIIRIDNPSCKYVAFQVNTSLRTSLMVRKKKVKSDTIETLKRTRGYYHVKAKPRSGMTDRAQVWLTYDMGTGVTVNSFNIPFEIISNVSGMNYRLFGGLTPTSYEMVMDNYSTWQGEGIYNWITTGKKLVMPNDTTSGQPTRYFHVFLDVILVDNTQQGEVNIPHFKVNGKDPIKAQLNLPQAGDLWGDVPPFAERSPLFKKKMAILGTSLSYGSISGNAVTWFNKLGAKYDMTYYNFGDNGDTVANQTTEAQPCMVNRWNTIPTGLDYFILEGGANDLRLNVPLGDVNSVDPNTFMGAINVIINGIRQANPKVKILCFTNWNRTSASFVNSIGKTNLDYVNAMISVANAQGVQVFDNYHNSGLNFFNSVTNVWQDEGIVTSGVANYHISDEAYTWLLPKYEQVLSVL